MDSPLNAMLFAEDLIEYILNKFNIDWKRTEGVGSLRQHIPNNRFREEIGEAVFSIIKQNKDACENNFKALKTQNLIAFEKYGYECSLTAVQTFKDGFHPETYLNMCAALAAHSWLGFKSLKQDEACDIASVSAQVLAYIINLFIYKCEFNPSTDWFWLAISAQKVRRRIERQRKMITENEQTGKC